MYVIFGTVIRSAPVKKGGELVKLDWGNKNVIRRHTIYPKEPEIQRDPNPRGNTRGCRGVEIIGDEIIAASYHSLNIYDWDLEFKRRVSNGLMVGLHEVKSYSQSTVWVASTAIDAALRCDIRTGEIKALQIFTDRQGKWWVTFAVRIDKPEAPADSRAFGYRGSGDAGRGRVEHRSFLSWVHSLNCKKWVIRKKREQILPTYVAKPCFVRGLDYFDGSLFVGISPATILEIDYETGELLDYFKYANDVRVAVHGLKIAK